MQTLPQPLLFSIYKFLDVSDIGNAAVTSMCLNNLSYNESFWLYLVKRDLTERPLPSNDSYKLYYLSAKKFLRDLKVAIDKFKEHRKIKMEYRSNMTFEMFMYDSNKNEYNYSFLLKAAKCGYEKSIVYILKNLDLRPDSNDYTIARRTTAICEAARNNRVECIEKLLSLGADIENVDGLGLTPLCHAVVGSALESVLFLINKGASAGAVTNSELEMLKNCDEKIKQEISALILKSKDKSQQRLHDGSC